MACFDAVPIQRGKAIADPFAGVATAGVHIVKRHSSFRGIEAHPLIAELSSLKFKPVDQLDGLQKYGVHLLSAMTMADIASEHPMVLRCFDEVTLSFLAGLRDEIESEPTHPYYKLARWALLATLRDTASVGVGWPYQRPGVQKNPRVKSPSSRFIMRLTHMAEDLSSMSGDVDGSVVHGDSRLAEAWANGLDGQKADGVISSPPYLNNFDYADATRLELYFLRYAKSWKEMTNTVRSSMMIATTQQTSGLSGVRLEEDLQNIKPIHSDINFIVEKLVIERKKRAKGKEYDRLVYQYFNDMSLILENMAMNVISGGKVALVIGDSAPYGVYVDTPKLIAMLASQYGFRLNNDQTLRLRGERWTGIQTRHSHTLSERLIVLTAP
ncbi:hypothetical protein ACFP9V_11570 [Deinococcus radiopugnans]|uniref:Uncharacterized protein n=1 Tax=Deinococcus radiopugnans ATCC 19172 TaxID=585398 RepID=A0A5C4Y8R6_9DEIO|nr:hypothetical protein [Deinococcus radiopugnans]MBB6015963.1 hypothetical protein [Deinococcus radiopugnans ATCC 19172]TNM72347.1 hypothetical protein FHR04_03355 [Deinococcus radiopugnans ATCC 19172]